MKPTFWYAVQLSIPDVCTKLQNPTSSSSWKIFDRKFAREKEKWTNKGTERPLRGYFFNTQYDLAFLMFVLNCKVL